VPLIGDTDHVQPKDSKNMEFDIEYGTNYWKERAAEGEDKIQLALWVGALIPILLAIAGWWIFQGFRQKRRR
jgi:hypothetical protein